MALTLALLPLDERPVNVRYPQMIAAIAGANVLIPPAELLGHLRQSADRDRCEQWLRENAKNAEALLVSAEFFAFGNLIQSRISQDSAADALTRLARLEKLNEITPVQAFSLITRIPNANNNIEEPLYWAEWGTRIARFSRLHDAREQGQISDTDSDQWRELLLEIPITLREDWISRRMRNHAVNLALMQMAASRRIESLLLVSDDSSPFGLSSRERKWLQSWRDLLPEDAACRIQMHPGADEVGSALVAASINRHYKSVPRVWTEWSFPEHSIIIAPYEDRPAKETVEGQIRACGCIPAPSLVESDIVLMVAAPSPRRSDYRPEYLAADREERAIGYRHFVERAADYQRHGRSVALADIAYPNGSDPLLMEILFSDDCPLRLSDLCAFGAWNTAGNTLGTVIAQASCAQRIESSPERKAAQGQFLAHRFLEDWGYQTVARRESRDWTQAKWGERDPNPDNPAQVSAAVAFVHAQLEQRLSYLQTYGIGTSLRLIPGSVRLPWNRLFEVDFMLEQSDQFSNHPE